MDLNTLNLHFPHKSLYGKYKFQHFFFSFICLVSLTGTHTPIKSLRFQLSMQICLFRHLWGHLWGFKNR